MSTDLIHDRDLGVIIEMVGQALPLSKFVRLGYRSLYTLFRFAEASRDEFTVLQRDANGVPIGLAFVTLKPQSLLFRLMTRSTFALWLILGINKIDWVKALRRDRSPAPSDLRPELFFLCVADGSRNRAIGRALLDAVEGRLLEAGLAAYVVKTEARPDNRAIQFYLNNGFRIIDTRTAYGVSNVHLEKIIVRNS